MNGLDFLGLGSKYWDVKGSLAAFPQGWCLGCFDSTFGNVIPNLRTFLESGKVGAVRVHLWWADSHVICPISVIKTRAPLYERLAQEFPNVRFFLSHSCEYSEHDKKAIQTRVDLLHQLARHCVVVNTPMGGSPVAGAAVTERHGVNALGFAGDLVSTDGQNIYDIDAEAWINKNRRADISFLWGLRFNLRQITEPGQKPPPPPKRTKAPSADYIRAVVRLADPAGVAPTPTFAGPFIPIKEPILYKTFAEDKQDSDDPRALKPVLIIPAHDSAAHILTHKGQDIGKLIYFGDYKGMHRYYAGLRAGVNAYGAQIAETAKRVSGSEFVWFKAGGKVYGPCNPAFRLGYFHA